MKLFGVTDYLVVSVMLLVSSVIGIYYRMTGGQQKTNNEYLLADRNMSALPVAFSLMARFHDYFIFPVLRDRFNLTKIGERSHRTTGHNIPFFKKEPP